MRIQANRRRRGFTLVELLVVMSIIAMLAAMLMPAVNAARETARRTQCINNQRNVVLALQQHNANNFGLPGWAEPMISWQSATSQGITPVLTSWVFPMLPYIERGDIFRQCTTISGPFYNQNPAAWPAASGGNPHIKVLVCPNDSTAVNNGMSISYVGNIGMRDGNPNSVAAAVGGGGNNAGSNNQDLPESAVFLNKYQNATSAYIKTQSLETIAGGDGTSNTMMISENLNANTWMFGQTVTPINVGYQEGYVGFAFGNSLDASSANVLKVNAGVIGGSVGSTCGASSYHPNGVVAGFCDGHTVFISQDIAWPTWTLLFTPRGDAIAYPFNNSGYGAFQFQNMVLNERY